MIRPTRSSDMQRLIEITRGTGVFKPAEIVGLQEVLDDYLAKPGGDAYHCYSYEAAGGVLGFTCHGPNTMTDRTWDLYWIAVAKTSQARGIGGELLAFAEQDIRRQNGRLIHVETSSLPSYQPTRRFYHKHGYQQAAVVADFYADGDSLVIFHKRVTP